MKTSPHGGTLARMRAMEKIVKAWGRPFECMKDLAPVKSGPCDGNLQIDHRYAGYARDKGNKLYRDIVQGRRNLSYFRLLCSRHNQSRKGAEGFR